MGLGTSQPSGASLACEPCLRGEYQNELGKQTCKRCDVGYYQDEEGGPTCKKRLGDTLPRAFLGRCHCLSQEICGANSVEPRCFPTLDVRLRCPDNSRTLQRGSLSFTDCGCIVGYINVANATAGLTTRRPTLEVGGRFHERKLFGPANELSDWIGTLFFPKVFHESFTVRISELYIVTSEDCCIFWRQAVSVTQVFMRDTKLFCERRSISNLPVSRGNCNAIHRRMVARVDLSESRCLRRQIELHRMPSGLDLPGDGHLDQSLVPARLAAVGGLTEGGL